MRKYQKFQQKMEDICSYSSKDQAALKYKELLKEVLEEFKKLEDKEIVRDSIPDSTWEFFCNNSKTLEEENNIWEIRY